MSPQRYRLPISFAIVNIFIYLLFEEIIYCWGAQYLYCRLKLPLIRAGHEQNAYVAKITLKRLLKNDN